MMAIYLTKMVKVIYPEPLGETYVPYTSTVSLEGKQWKIVADTTGDTNGTGIYEKCFLMIDLTDEDNAILEADNDILRIDTL